MPSEMPEWLETEEDIRKNKPAPLPETHLEGLEDYGTNIDRALGAFTEEREMAKKLSEMIDALELTSEDGRKKFKEIYDRISDKILELSSEDRKTLTEPFSSLLIKMSKKILDQYPGEENKFYKKFINDPLYKEIVKQEIKK